MPTALQSAHAQYFGPPFEDAKVRDAMRVGVITCQPQTSLTDVAKMMAGYSVHSVVVDDPQASDHPWGIVSALDIAKVGESDLADLTARDVASTDLITVSAGESLARAAELMAQNQVSHLIATQPETGHPVGVISALGLTVVLATGRH
jgi:CBS domain-containing protein